MITYIYEIFGEIERKLRKQKVTKNTSFLNPQREKTYFYSFKLIPDSF